jgi:hypothetical protein
MTADRMMTAQRLCIPVAIGIFRLLQGVSLKAYRWRA